VTTYLIIATTAVAGLLGLLVWRRPAIARALAIGSSAFVAIVAAGAMLRTTQAAVLETPFGLSFERLTVPLDLGTSRTVAAVAFVVALVAAAVQVYSTWYLADDDRYGLFAATVSLFTSAMLLLVHSHGPPSRPSW
jgi:NADH-quinone oxidoreductase subunit L